MSAEPFAMVPLPAGRSRAKPRQRGLTMMMDWGLPLGAQADWLGLLAPHVDLAKLVVGTARLYPEPYLREKLALYARHQVQPFLGGQFLEYVIATQGMAGVAPYCNEARRLGIEAIEVSDNVVPLDDAQRRDVIRTAVAAGLHVHGEVGSKSDDSGAETLIAQAEVALEAGADVVLVEGAELVRDGRVNDALLADLRAGLDVDRVIFELSGPWITGTTLSDVYQLKRFLIETFGPDVNLANIMPDQVWETETLRAGLSVTGPPTS
ncbi:MAG: phosphosulfolactate synthase [Ectothiorhodospiraceae bacterium]|nr:phosphosulfolactate synthase [Ectothiorhodospiraceae bacterium]